MQAAHRLHEPALQPVRRPDGRARTCASSAGSTVCAAARLASARPGRCTRRTSRASRTASPAHAAGRLEAAARPRLRGAPPAAGGVPRRADRRRRPHLAAALLEADRRDGGRGRDAPRHHPLPRRGRALRPHRAHPRRPPGCARDRLRAEAGVRRARVLEVSCPRFLATPSSAPRARQPWVLEASVFGTRIHVVVEDAEEGRRRASRSSWPVWATPPAAVERIVPSLEDVFIHTIQAAESAGEGARHEADPRGGGEGAAPGPRAIP